MNCLFCKLGAFTEQELVAHIRKELKISRMNAQKIVDQQSLAEFWRQKIEQKEGILV